MSILVVNCIYSRYKKTTCSILRKATLYRYMLLTILQVYANKEYTVETLSTCVQHKFIYNIIFSYTYVQLWEQAARVVTVRHTVWQCCIEKSNFHLNLDTDLCLTTTPSKFGCVKCGVM